MITFGPGPTPPPGPEAQLDRIEAKLDRLLAAMVLTVPPCPPHDFPRIWVGKKGEVKPMRVCRKCAAVDPDEETLYPEAG